MNKLNKDEILEKVEKKSVASFDDTTAPGRILSVTSSKE